MKKERKYEELWKSTSKLGTKRKKWIGNKKRGKSWIFQVGFCCFLNCQ